MKIAGFISYSHADGSDLAQGLARYLKNLFPNFVPVYDEDVSRGEELEKIPEKLRLCHILIVIITPAALQSRQVKEEIRIAKENGMKILPCKNVSVNMDWNELPPEFKGHLGIEFEHGNELNRLTYSPLLKNLKKLSRELQKSIPKTTKTEKSKPTKQEIKSLKTPSGKLSWDKFTIKTKKKDHNIMATIYSGKIKDILLDRKAISLLVKTQTTEDGFLRIIVRRDLIDAKFEEKDENFIVLVDGEEVNYDEMPTSIKQRALQIKISKGTKEIEIIGTEREGISYVGEVKEKNIVRILQGSSVPGDNFLDPETLEIKSGEKVLWINDDTAAHTVTSYEQDNAPSGLFDSSLFMSKATFEVTFHNKGTYNYFDMVHPWIKGKIIVK